MFNHFDHNKDDCLEVEDEIVEFNEIDVNRMYKTWFPIYFFLERLENKNVLHTYFPHLLLSI